eukprot:NODE_6901_length_429_cov_43.807895_g5292_i0.p3 GENE.NODE_6901_length_429_cov_43.807895_g5292_i0~~NODE_6901_length_429_cov_43.807895_g5292_i0.p3  ORF type:complete len:52 (+),score=0.85 NODE_6901_length_429_cov_43.807895_g5292_i0:189-344(+)
MEKKQARFVHFFLSLVCLCIYGFHSPFMAVRFMLPLYVPALYRGVHCFRLV